MRLVLQLLLDIGIALACVDVFFVLEGPKHKDHAIRVAKAIHLAKEDREAFVLIQKKRELAVKKVVNDHSLRSSIELIRLAQPLSSTLETVVEQIAERKTDRPLVVLVFTEKDLDKKQLEKFQFSSKYHKLYVFLMRTDHLKRNKRDPLEFAAEDVLGNGNNSLEEILQCSKKTKKKDKRQHAFRRRWIRSLASEADETTVPESLIPFANPDETVTSPIFSGGNAEESSGEEPRDEINVTDEPVASIQLLERPIIFPKFAEGPHSIQPQEDIGQIITKGADIPEIINRNDRSDNAPYQPRTELEENSSQLNNDDELIPRQINAREAVIFRDDPKQRSFDTLTQVLTPLQPNIIDKEQKLEETVVGLKSQANLMTTAEREIGELFTLTTQALAPIAAETTEIPKAVVPETSGPTILVDEVDFAQSLPINEHKNRDSLEPTNLESRVQEPTENVQFKARDEEQQSVEDIDVHIEDIVEAEEEETAPFKSTTALLGKETTNTAAAITTTKKTFSKTSRVTRSTTPRKTSSTTRRPVIFNRSSNSIDQNSLSVNENFFASSPSSTTTRHIRTTKRATTTAQQFTQKRANRFGSRVSDSPSTRRTVTTIATTASTTRAATKPPPGCQADVLFLMDFSRGAEEKLEHYLRIAEAIASTLPIDENLVRVGMIKFSGPGRQESLFSLKSHKTPEGVIGAIRKAADSQRGGTTRTGEALLYAEKDFHKFKGGREGVSKHIVLFTDGWSQEDPTAAAHELRRSGVSVYVIGVKDLYLPPNLEEMKEIAGDANNVFIEPEGRQIRGKIVGSCRI